MQKRGQVTTFIILGIVVFAVFGLVFYYRDLVLEQAIGPEQTKKLLNTQIEFIKDDIGKCISQESKSSLELLGKQGGKFTPEKSRMYQENKVSYLCYDIPDSEKCSNQALTPLLMEDELNKKLKDDVYFCINKLDFSNNDRFNVNKGEFILSTAINPENILISVEYPIELERNGITANLDRFSKTINVPLSKITIAVNDILDTEALGNDFDTNRYNMLTRSTYDIFKYKLAGDRVYTVNVRGNSYKFYFAVEGGA